ncbi:hypothetical protein HWV62_32495 [Athelia sp. TMB]|nr:hypothetical protein HWV62_32495 [Athelia sp. TMB]
MTYKIAICLYQNQPNAFFHVVEKTVFNYAKGGCWSEMDGMMVLEMPESGTSGTLRFMADTGEAFCIAVGIHNHKRWCDIVSNLKNDQTGVLINREYYNNGGRDHQREKQLASFSTKNAQGRNMAIKFTKEEGEHLKANVIIG